MDNTLFLIVNGNITGTFSADDRITITNTGTTFQNIGNVADVINTLNNASGGTSDFQIRAVINPFQGQANRTGVSLEAQGTSTLLKGPGPSERPNTRPRWPQYGPELG